MTIQCHNPSVQLPLTCGLPFFYIIYSIPSIRSVLSSTICLLPQNSLSASQSSPCSSPLLHFSLNPHACATRSKYNLSSSLSHLSLNLNPGCHTTRSI